MADNLMGVEPALKKSAFFYSFKGSGSVVRTVVGKCYLITRSQGRHKQAIPTGLRAAFPDQPGSL